MIYKLPPWAWVGGWILAFVAGIVNATGFLGFERQAITHLTGTTSMLAVSVATWNVPMIRRLSLLLGSFMAGCVTSGFMIQDNALQPGRRYGLALLLESVTLCAATFLLRHGNETGLFLAAGACGLQNAMVSTFSGAVIRTTHVSGMFTDLGIFLGHALRGLPVETLRLRLCLLIISAFFSGGIVGALGYRSAGYSILFLPAGITALTAIYYELRCNDRSA